MGNGDEEDDCEVDGRYVSDVDRGANDTITFRLLDGVSPGTETLVRGTGHATSVNNRNHTRSNR